MTTRIDATQLVGSHDVLFITLDTLRYDVAARALEEGKTPFLASLMAHGNSEDGSWEERHSPGSFTYAAHHAFFAGFLPTPATPGIHERLFATRFEGSQTTSERTLVFDAPDIVSGFSGLGYTTVCIGGVGFFNKQTPLSSVLPGFFQESWWHPEFAVNEPCSTEHQVAFARNRLSQLTDEQRIFLFINVAACHQPNRHYVDGATVDTAETQASALSYVDAQLEPLVHDMNRRAPLLVIVTSDHGTAYGEEGFTGHRLGHPVVWTVPYLETVLARGAS